MTRLANSEDFQPIAWIGRHPVYVPTALVILHFLTMAATATLAGVGKFAFLSQLIFSSNAVAHHYAIWQFATYAFINQPSFWFLVEMVMLYYFGRQVESFIGRRSFLALYSFLLLLPPCILMAVGAFMPVTYVGSQILHFCVFIAFACLYPTVEIFFSIQARWVAGCLLLIYSLQMLAGQAWIQLLVLFLSALTAFFFIGRLRYGFEIPGLHRLQSWLAARRRRIRRPSKPAGPSPKANSQRARNEDLLETVDSLLEKISSKGIASLSDKEREQLANASEELKRSERHVHP